MKRANSFFFEKKSKANGKNKTKKKKEEECVDKIYTKATAYVRICVSMWETGSHLLVKFVLNQ